MREFVPSSLTLSRLTWGPEAHRLLFFLAWLMRVHGVRVFSKETKDSEPSEATKTFLMGYKSPIF